MANGVQTVTSPSADLALVRLDRSVSATYARLGQPGTVRVGQSVQVYGWGATSRCGSEINCQSQYLKVANVSVTQAATTPTTARRYAPVPLTASPRAATPAVR